MFAGLNGRGKFLAGLISALGMTGGINAALSEEPVYPKPSSAYQAAAGALADAWAQSDLVFSVATFTAEPAAGYGRYTPRPNALFSGSEPLHVYAEPIGYGFETSGSDQSYKLSVSFRLLNTTGQVLSEQTGFTTVSGTSRTAQRELSTTLTFQFDGLPAGSYVLETIYQDLVASKTGTVSLPFVVATSQ